MQDVTKTLEAMELRLKRLEGKVFGEEPEPLPSPAVPPRPTPVELPPVEPPVIPTPPVVVPNVPTTPAAPPFKIDIGRVLNVGGIAFLVIGVAFLLMYSWQYLGAWFKVGGGLALSGFLIGWGERLSKRETNQWYGQGLISGGWALAYFVVYAMQNIAGVKVLDNVMLGSTLLLGLAGGCMAHAVRKRAQVIAELSTVLAFITISLSSITWFSVLAFALLVIGVSTITVKMQWQRVFAFSTVGSYLTFVLFTQPQIAASAADPLSGLLLSGGFLLLFWLAHNAVAYFFGESGRLSDFTFASFTKGTSMPGVTAALMVLNAACFVSLGLWSLGDAGLADARYLFLFLTGAVYLASTPFYLRRGEILSYVTSLVGLGFATAAIPLRLNAQATNGVWLAESLLLVWAGLRFNLVSFRWFANALLAILTLGVVDQIMTERLVINVFGWAAEWRVLIGLFAAAVFGASSYLFRQAEDSGTLKSYEVGTMHRIHFVVAGFMLWFVPFATAGATMLPIYWLAVAGLLLAIATRSGDMLKHGAATLFAASACAAVCFNYPTMPLATAIGTFVATAAASLAYRFAPMPKLPQVGKVTLHRVYMLLAGGAAMLFTTLDYGSPAAGSVVLFFEVAAVIAAALLLRDRFLVSAGTLASAIVSGALLFNFGDWTWLTILPVVALVYVASALFGRIAANGGLTGAQFTEDEWAVPAQDARFFCSGYGVVASALLSVAFATLLSGPWISVAWALQGVTLIGISFRTGNRAYEVCGLSIFAVLAAKVLFLDFADAETIQRILSFIVTGIAFLVGSYAYAWVRRKARSQS